MKGFGVFLLLASLWMTPSVAQQAGDELVIRMRSGEIGFNRARLHLPSGDRPALTEGGIWVDGQLVGFLGDYIPFADGTHALRISKFDGDCLGEEFTYRFQVQGMLVRPLGGELKSACRELLSWPKPELLLRDGQELYFEMRFAKPVTRPKDSFHVGPAMHGPPKFVLVRFQSDPPGSTIYLDDEVQRQKTNVRLSVPYMEGAEEENRYLIRQQGLVNCYGAYPLTRRRVTVKCLHRDVR